MNIIKQDSGVRAVKKALGMTPTRRKKTRRNGASKKAYLRGVRKGKAIARRSKRRSRGRY